MIYFKKVKKGSKVQNLLKRSRNLYISFYPFVLEVMFNGKTKEKSFLICSENVQKYMNIIISRKNKKLILNKKIFLAGCCVILVACHGLFLTKKWFIENLEKKFFLTEKSCILW